METVITFTPAQLWTGLLAICAALVSISAAMSVIGKWVDRGKKPNVAQNARLDEHEKWLKKHDDEIETLKGHLDKDKRRLDSIEEGNRVTQKALLALLAHAIDGNNIEPCREAKTDVEQYLISR